MKKNMQNGITLVALVITIILLLILAAISIQALTNQGLFSQAQNAKTASEIANIKEQIQLDIYEKQLEPPLGDITEEQLKTILGKYGTISYEEDGITIKGITTEKEYEILLKDIYGGETVAESVPDGAIVNPVNDITTWLKTAGISEQYSYTTIEEVITDSACTESLMKNENAMKYLARSTEFADAICTSETTMTYLGQSSYVDDTVLNSDILKQSVKASQYWTLIYASKTVKIYGAASENITIEGYYGSFTTGTDGSCSHVVPIDMITLTGSVSGQSFTRTVTDNTTEVKVMPEGALYWYGNEIVSHKVLLHPSYQSTGTTLVRNKNSYALINNGSGDGPHYLYYNIDISNLSYTKIRSISVFSATELPNTWVGIGATPTLDAWSNDMEYKTYNELSGSNYEYTFVDKSKNKYPLFGMNRWKGTMSLEVSALWLE